MNEVRRQLPLRKCKLWWPAWQQGIPFTAYGFTNAVTGDGYSFRVDPKMDSWLCVNGDLMPIDTSRLMHNETGRLKWTSFSFIDHDNVQVNFRIPGADDYHIDIYAADDLYFEGATYSPDE